MDGINFRKLVYEVSNGVFGKKVNNADRNISENALHLTERKRCLRKICMSVRSGENDGNVKNVEKVLKYELNRYEGEAMDKITEDMEHTARWHKSSYCTGMLINWEWVVNLEAPVKDRNEATSGDKDRVKAR